MLHRTGQTTDAQDLARDAVVNAKAARKYAELSAEFAKHQMELKKLHARVDHLQKTSRGGGMPWTLLLLVGGAYALYRSNETVRTQVDGLLSRVMPDSGSQDGQEQGTSSGAAGMTPGQSGNEAYGMGTPSTGARTSGTGSRPGDPDTGKSSSASTPRP